ncbi:hypothetical protein INT43_004815 [Umbelopsis isabellina]|uniref:ELYS-like domain-containing protein n=1 Tax=Mortierella isabellina TaxID=91625 RepID=A0A8H7PE67_MORIS|nr:hypothetical protein INT43_004815 [Umbelopsis isabellina]
MPRDSHVEVTLNVRNGCRRHNIGTVAGAVTRTNRQLFEQHVERYWKVSLQKWREPNKDIHELALLLSLNNRLHTMVRPVANSYALTALAAHEKPSDIIGGSLVCITENSTLQSHCPSIAFIYRYTSTRLEVRDYFDADSIYATLLSPTLPSDQKLKANSKNNLEYQRANWDKRGPLSSCAGNRERVPLYFIVKQSRSQSVASIEVCVPAVSTTKQAYIFVGGFNGEIEVMSYGEVQNEYGVIDSKIVTTLWKNMPVVKMSVYDLANNEEELVILAGQAERGCSDQGQTSRTPSMTILKVRVPSLKSMEVGKKEMTSKATDAALMLPPNSTTIIAMDLYVSGTDDIIYLSSIWAYQPPNRIGRVMYACWKVSSNIDKIDFLRQHVVKTTSRLLDACMSGTLSTVAILCCSGLDVAYTTNFQCIKGDARKHLYDYDATARTIRANENDEKHQTYDEKRSMLGSLLIIDKLLIAKGYGVQSQFRSSGQIISDALLYTVLDAMGETEFCNLSEDNHLSHDTRQRIQEYWSVDNLQIQGIQSVRQLKRATTYSDNYIWAIKQQFGVSAAVDFMKTHHIPVDGISDWEVASAFLECSPSFDAALCLSQPSFKTLNHSDIQKFLPRLVSRWFKAAYLEIEGNKRLSARLLGVAFDHTLERELVKYCSITNPSPANLSFLFSYYLNRYRYAEAMMIHDKLSQYEDESNVAMQQRKVIIDCTSKLVPSIQLKLALLDADNLTETQCGFSF